MAMLSILLSQVVISLMSGGMSVLIGIGLSAITES